jgi:DNA processing protein
MLKLLNNNNSYSLDKEAFSILRLIRSENIGIRTFHNLMKYYGSASKAVENIPEFIKRSGYSKISLFSNDQAEKEILDMEKEGAKYISYLDPKFSSNLKNINDCPPILSYKGKIELMNNKSVAIVGARNCSISGKHFAGKIAKELSEKNITVTSGLARGIDTEAHINSKPNTIAVIAGGIDNIYPPENHKLYKEIAENGLILAELPIRSVPLARHFPQRNRIISGLSNAVVVIEASLSSGSLITANFAIEQNREIFACPGFPLDPRCRGTNKLIKDGANLLESSDEIIAIIEDSKFSEIHDHKKKIEIHPIHKIIDESLLNKENRKILLECLSSIPFSIEDIAQEVNLPMPIVITILLELELQGKIVYHPGNKYSLDYRNL